MISPAPRARSSATTNDPRNPAPPVTTTRLPSKYLLCCWLIVVPLAHFGSARQVGSRHSPPWRESSLPAFARSCDGGLEHEIHPGARGDEQARQAIGGGEGARHQRALAERRQTEARVQEHALDGEGL